MDRLPKGEKKSFLIGVICFITGLFMMYSLDQIAYEELALKHGRLIEKYQILLDEIEDKIEINTKDNDTIRDTNINHKV